MLAITTINLIPRTNIDFVLTDTHYYDVQVKIWNELTWQMAVSFVRFDAHELSKGRWVVVGGSHDDGESTASMMAYFGWAGKKEKYCLVNIHGASRQEKKRDIIMITESKYTHTHTHTCIYIIFI